MDKPTERKDKQNPSNQQPKPLGCDTLFFEACKGRIIKCTLMTGELDSITGTMTAYDKYGMVLDTNTSDWKHGLVYVFKASLAWFHPVDDK